METALINGLFLILGTVITSCVTLLNNHISKKKKNIAKQVSYLCRQAISYYEIEELYVQEISRLRNMFNEKYAAPKTIKDSFREKIRDAGLESIDITANRAQSILKNIEL